MAQPFFASRDPSIAQSIYNLGEAFFGPEARRRRAENEQSDAVAQARIRNLGADTEYTVSRTAGQNFTNDQRRRAVEEATRLYGTLGGIFAGMSENPNSNSQAVYRESGRQQAGIMEKTKAEGDFAGQRNDADNRTRVAMNDADNATRVKLGHVVLSDGQTAILPPNSPFLPGTNQPAIPAMTDNERTPGGFILQGNPVPVPPVAVPPPGATVNVTHSVPATQPNLGAAFAPPAPVVRGNTISIPEKPKAAKAEDPMAVDNKGLSLIKERSASLGDIVNILTGRVKDATGYDNIDPSVANEIARVALENLKAGGFTGDYAAGLDEVQKRLKLEFKKDTGSGWNPWDNKAQVLINGQPASVDAIRAALGQAPVAPEAQTVPAVQPAAAPAAPAVDFSKPFEAKTQADIEAWKASAPAGAVIIINGKPYTK